MRRTMNPLGFGPALTVTAAMARANKALVNMVLDSVSGISDSLRLLTLESGKLA